MSIWNKVLAWLIGLSAIGLLIMAARAMQVRACYMDAAQKLEKSIARVKEDNRILRQGTAENPGILALTTELYKWQVSRPRVVANCVAQVPKGAATIAVSTDPAKPHGIVPNNRIFAFEQGDATAPGGFLGEFNVVAADAKGLTLAPAYPLTAADLKMIESATRPWVIYDQLPSDSHEAFAGLTDEQIKATLPAGTADEYAKDGKPADEKDPPERIVDKNYVRQLRDYAHLLDFYRRQYTVLVDENEATKRDRALAEESAADAQRQFQFFQNLNAEIKAKLEKTEKERDVVGKFEGENPTGGLIKMLKDKIASIDAAIERTIKENKAMAGQIAQKQLEAAREIDARTRAVARTAAGGEK